MDTEERAALTNRKIWRRFLPIIPIAAGFLCAVTAYFEFVLLPIDSKTEAEIRFALETYTRAIYIPDWDMLSTAATERIVEFYRTYGREPGISGELTSMKILEYTHTYAIVEYESRIERTSGNFLVGGDRCTLLLHTPEGWKVDDEALFWSGCSVLAEYSRSPFRLFRWLLSWSD